MTLYIQTQEGQPINHPALEDNLLQVFGAVPENWEPFVRVEKPIPTMYQVLEAEEPVYTKVDGVWTDVWPLRNMIAEEKTAKQQTVIDVFNAREQATNWSAWTLDEDTCKMVPPIPRPEPDLTKLNAGIRTFWCGADNNWKDTPVYSEGSYKFDFFAWVWVAI